jgi:hypothetical protein
MKIEKVRIIDIRKQKIKKFVLNLESENGRGVGEAVIKNCWGDTKSIIYGSEYPRIY